VRRGRIPWVALAVLLLALATAGVVVLAVHKSHEPPAVESSPTTSASPQTSASEGGSKAPDVQPPLSMVDSTIAFLAVPGDCRGTSTLERTTDGGKNWTPVSPPVPEILGLDPKSAESLHLLGADRDCGVGSYSTGDVGKQWLGPEPVTGQWYRRPDTTQQIVTPSGGAPNPCADSNRDVISIAPVDNKTAFVLCVDGAVESTTDGGKTWTNPATVDGAVALAWADANQGWLLTIDRTECPGLQVRVSVNAGQTWTSGGCVGGLGLVTASSQRPSIAFADLEDGMVTVGGKTLVTTDGGMTWVPA
jgi:photosystem II stability/assembly factor-like uncharacterized protein